MKNSTQTVILEPKDVYGKKMLYPYNDNAKHFSAIAGKRTLDEYDIAQIRALGFEVQFAYSFAF